MKTYGEPITQQLQDQTTNFEIPIFVYLLAKEKGFFD